MNTQWLFLDFDNTLMATEQFTVPSLIARFNELYGHKIDHPLTQEEFKQHFHGQGRETLCDNLGQYFNITVDYPTLYQHRESNIMRHYQQLPHGIPMAPHLLEVLSLLASQSISFALVSNNPIQRAFAAMRFADNKQGMTLARFFGPYCFEAGAQQKPQPDVYQLALSQTQASLSHSWAIEDSLTGARAAIAAGMKTLIYTGLSHPAEDIITQMREIGCLALFDDWRQLPGLIRKYAVWDPEPFSS